MKNALVVIVIVAMLVLWGHFGLQEQEQERNKAPAVGMAQIEVQTEVVVKVPDLNEELDSHFLNSPILNVPPGVHAVEARYDQGSEYSLEPAVFTVRFVAGHRYKFNTLSTSSSAMFWVGDTVDGSLIRRILPDTKDPQERHLEALVLDAARRGDVSKVARLLRIQMNLISCADVDGKTPLHWAALGSSKDVVELLLANSAEVNAKDCNGDTALHLAVVNHHDDVAELLRRNGGRE